jgi:ribosomal protein S20
MREINSILRNDIFGLNESDALALSRYLIEDSPTDHVYCDPNNENLRSVVKSIVKNVIGDYEVNRGGSKVVKEATDLLEKYHTNLESALKVTAPKGIISKKKLVELFKGLGI